MDQSLSNLTKVHDWLHFYDQLHHRVVSTQEWELMAYTPYAIVPWHPHLASPANAERPVEYPKADYEVCSHAVQDSVKLIASRRSGLSQNVDKQRRRNSSSQIDTTQSEITLQLDHFLDGTRADADAHHLAKSEARESPGPRIHPAIAQSQNMEIGQRQPRPRGRQDPLDASCRLDAESEFDLLP